MVRSIGERLHEPQPTFYVVPDAAGGQPQGTIHVTDDESWIRGYDWIGYEEQTLRCLSCSKDVSFPADQKTAQHPQDRGAGPVRERLTDARAFGLPYVSFVRAQPSS